MTLHTSKVERLVGEGPDFLIALRTSANALGQVQEKKEASRYAGLVLIRHHSWPLFKCQARGGGGGWVGGFLKLLAVEGVGGTVCEEGGWGGGQGGRERRVEGCEHVHHPSSLPRARVNHTHARK